MLPAHCYHPMPSGSRRLITARAGCVYPDAARFLFAALLLAARSLAAAPTPEKLTGPASCAECHPTEIEVWKASTHFKSLHLAHRTPEAAQIVAKLGLQPMKTEAGLPGLPLRRQGGGGRSRSLRPLLRIVPRRGERLDQAPRRLRNRRKKGNGDRRTPRRRIAGAVAHGMINPRGFVRPGPDCYTCHVLQDEKLANVGGHVPGSAGFNPAGLVPGRSAPQRARRRPPRQPRGHAGKQAAPAGRGLDPRNGIQFSAPPRMRRRRRAYGVTYARRADAARKMLEKIQTLAPTAATGRDPRGRAPRRPAVEQQRGTHRRRRPHRRAGPRVFRPGHRRPNWPHSTPCCRDRTPTRARPSWSRRPDFSATMAKSRSRPSFFGGSVPPQGRSTRVAEPERWTRRSAAR